MSQHSQFRLWQPLAAAGFLTAYAVLASVALGTQVLVRLMLGAPKNSPKTE